MYRRLGYSISGRHGLRLQLLLFLFLLLDHYACSKCSTHFVLFSLFWSACCVPYAMIWSCYIIVLYGMLWSVRDNGLKEWERIKGLNLLKSGRL